jgi:hypothetical protein
MATSYTTLLGLALPVTGELSGTWGDTVNNSITSLLDSAIAGTTTLSTDADVTLTTTTGAANTSREAILLWTAGGTVTRNITAPAQSKIYTVINASSSTQSIVLRGAGPTTGVTIIKGESAVCAWNGSDFIKISNTSGAGVFSSITNTGLTSGRVVYSTTGGLETDSANLLFNGTTLTANTLNLTNALGTTYGGTGLTSFTANGVVYASSSSVLATGSALVFDGTNLGIGTSSPASPLQVNSAIAPTSGSILRIDNTATTTYNGSAYVGGQIHLNYTNATGRYGGINFSNTGVSSQDFFGTVQNSGGFGDFVFQGYGALGYIERMRLDSSGNLGLGVTPSAWGTSFKVLQFANAASISSSNDPTLQITQNGFYNGTNWIYSTTAPVSNYYQSAGTHVWRNAPSGTAGNAITFTQAMTLDASGNLLVGATATSAGARLYVRGSGSSNAAARFYNPDLTDSNFTLYVDKPSTTTTTSQVFIGFTVNAQGTGSGQINANGASQAAFGSFSDARLKENIVDLTPQLSNLMALRPVEFDYKDGSGHQTGFVAQEMQQVYSDAVGEQNGFLTVSGYGKTEARLIKAIQEQQTLIESLTTRLTALEGKA